MNSFRPFPSMTGYDEEKDGWGNISSAIYAGAFAGSTGRAIKPAVAFKGEVTTAGYLVSCTFPTLLERKVCQSSSPTFI